MIRAVLVNNKEEETHTLIQMLRYLTAYLTDEKLDIEVLKDGADSQNALDGREELHLAIIDACTENGLSFAKSIRERYREVQIMIVADTKISPMVYMHPSICASALLLRPFDKEEISQTMEEFFRLAVVSFIEKDDRTFWARTQEGTTKIPFHAIYYFEAREKKIFARTKTEDFGFGGTLDKLMEELPEFFLRCHRSYVANREKIMVVRLADGMVIMKDNLMVPVSRSYKKLLKEYIHGDRQV